MTDFSDVQVFTGKELAMAKDNTPVSSGTAIEQSRAVSETQAAMIVARMNPRNEEGSYLKIIKACKRLTLANHAEYAYPRGGKMVTGATIRIAEVLAQNWGNITYGYRETGRVGDMSEVEAFAWDLEANTRVTRAFFVRHFRDTKTGGQKLKDERDKYEFVASQAQRRVRACILEIIPGDIVEAAVNQCRNTITAGDGTPLEDRIKAMLVKFDEIGVSQKMIEDRLQHKTKAIVGSELVSLTTIYKSINDGVADRKDFFNLDTAVSSDKKKKDKAKEPDNEIIEANIMFNETKATDLESFNNAKAAAGIKGSRITNIDDFEKFMICYNDIKRDKNDNL